MSNAWICSGGGASGCVSAGAMGELTKTAPPHHLFGNSAGSLNAAAYSIIGPDRMIRIWQSIKSMDDIFKKRGPFAWSLLTNQSFYTSAPLRELLRKNLLGYTVQIPFAVNVVDLKSGLVMRPAFDRGQRVTMDMIDWIVASASIPALTPPVQDRYVDGGLQENIPLSAAIKKDFKKIVLFLNEPLNIDAIPPYKEDVKGLRAVAARSLELLMMESYRNDIALLRERNMSDDFDEIDLTVVAPKSHVLGVLDFNSRMIYAGLKAGRDAATALVDAR
jgi:predicted acylesterase/phospholipase RssA